MSRTVASSAVVALLAVGCSLSTVRPDTCTSNVQCREAFGLGSICGAEGLCETTTLPERCSTVWPEDLSLPVDPATTFVVGTVFDHGLETHVGRYRSAQLALSQANVGDGLEEASFAVVHCTNQEGLDELSHEEASVAGAIWLADELGVPAIVGPAASADTEAVYNAVGEAFGALVISPSATSPSLTPLDGLVSTDEEPGLLWRTAPPDSLQGLAIARDMLENTSAFRPEAPARVAVIYQVGAYGEGLEATFTDAFVAGGGRESLPFPFESALGPGDAIADAAQEGVDEVLFVSSDANDIVAFLLGANANPTVSALPLFLTDAARNADVLDGASSASDLFPQIRGTGPANPEGPIFDSFAASYAAEYGGDDVRALSYTAQAFDAAWLVVYGHAWSLAQEGEVTGLGIARGLRRVSSGTAVEIRPTSWNQVKASFGDGQSVDVTGASGRLDFDPTTAETSAVIEVWTIDGDAFVAVEAFEP